MRGIDAEDPMPSPQAHAPYSRRRRWRVPEARAALDALAASGLSVSAFAEQEGLDQERLYRWRRRFARDRKVEGCAVTPPATPAIIELRAAKSPRPWSAETVPVEIVLVSGIVLRVAETIDPARLARLIAALERGC
jgi:transposase-like protein